MRSLRLEAHREDLSFLRGHQEAQDENFFVEMRLSAQNDENAPLCGPRSYGDDYRTFQNFKPEGGVRYQIEKDQYDFGAEYWKTYGGLVHQRPAALPRQISYSTSGWIEYTSIDLEHGSTGRYSVQICLDKYGDCFSRSGDFNTKGCS